MKPRHANFIKNAMLMAAGLGTRLRPFTEVQTKALLPLMGVPIAQFSVDSLVAAGVEKIVANVHHQGKKSADGLTRLEFGNSQLVISDESGQLLGSAGGIKKALSHFGNEPFFLANADVLCDVNWNELSACHQSLRSKSGVILTLTVFSAGPPGGKYREIQFDSTTGLIRNLGDLVEGRPFFVGAAVLEPEALLQVPGGVPSDFVRSILQPAIDEGRAGVFVSQGSWFDIGEPQLWLKAHLDLINKSEQFYSQSSSTLDPEGLKDSVLGRIMGKNLRLSEGIWVSRDGFIGDCSKWIAPCYWNADSGLTGGKVTQMNGANKLGPDAVLYGPFVRGESYNGGIGFGGEWVSL